MAKTSRIKKYKKNIKIAQDYQDEGDWKSNGKRFLEYFKGKYYTKDSSYARYTVDTIYNVVNLMVPNLAGARTLEIKVKPSRKNYIRKLKDGKHKVVPGWRSAGIVECVLNKILKNIKFANTVRQCIQDCIFYGFAVVKVGYGLETVRNPNLEEPETDDTPRVKEEGVFVDRISPTMFLFDPNATSMNDARYVVHELTVPVEDVRNNDLYKNTDDKNIFGELPEKIKDRSEQHEKLADELVTIREYHDLIENKIAVLPNEGNRFLRDPRDNPLEMMGSHFVVLKFSGDTDEFRGIPFARVAEDKARGINETVTKMVRHLDMFPGQVMTEESAMSEEQMDGLEDGFQGSILKVRDGAINEGRVQKQPPIPMGSDYFNVIAQLQQLLDRDLNISDIRRPATSKRKTAAEVTFEQVDATTLRKYFVGFVSDFVEEIVSKVVAVIQQEYDHEDVIRMDGRFGSEWIEWTKEDIKGEFDFEYIPYDAENSGNVKSQQMINLINILAAHSQSVPTFREALMQIDGKEFTKEIWGYLGVQYEKFTKVRETAHMEFDPERENELVESGSVLPDPLVTEPHRAHLEAHIPKLQDLVDSLQTKKAEELERHIKMHLFMADIASGKINPGEIEQNVQNQPQQPRPAGSQASPFQGSPQPRTEAELAGNFYGNQ